MANLKLVPTLTEKDEMFYTLVLTKSKVSVMMRGENFTFVSALTGKADLYEKEFYLSFPSQELFSFREKLEGLLDKEFLATISLKSNVYGLNFKIKAITVDGLLCEFPSQLYLINRRTSRRKNIPEVVGGARMHLDLNLPHLSTAPFRVPVADLSYEGLSLKTPPSLAFSFKRDQIIHAKLVINAKTVNVILEVKNIFASTESSYPFRVGCKFFKVNESVQHLINQTVDTLK